jgi:gas vesicle protein
MKHIKMLGAGSVVAVVVLSASVALAAPLSEEKWRKQGNKICKQVNQDLEEIAQEVFAGLRPGKEPSDEQLTAYVAQFVPAIEGAVSSIDALNEPKSVKKDLKKFKAAVGQALDTIEADPGAVTGSKDPFAKVDKIGKRLGLKACT